jgi:hypothetical protein
MWWYERQRKTIRAGKDLPSARHTRSTDGVLVIFDTNGSRLEWADNVVEMFEECRP